MSETIIVYFDYLCPYAWRGAEFAKMIEEPLDLSFDWRHYSLYQGNYKGDDDWQLWEDELDLTAKDGGKGLLAFLAAHYVEVNAPEAYDGFRLALQRLGHEELEGFSAKPVKKALAKALSDVGIDFNVKELDIIFGNQELRKHLADAHAEAVAKNVVATPTFFFEDGNASYFRIAKVPATEQEAIELFKHYTEMLSKFPYVETLRRPKYT